MNCSSLGSLWRPFDGIEMKAGFKRQASHFKCFIVDVVVGSSRSLICAFYEHRLMMAGFVNYFVFDEN